MFDFVLGIALAGLAVRGWLRGFVREVLDLIGLVLGVWVAFALSGPLGNFLSDRFGVTPEVARIGSGILLFVLFGVALSIGAHFLSTVMRLPGLNLVNRLGGAAVATAWGVAVIVVFVNISGVIPLPESVDAAISESAVVGAVAGDGALPQRVFEALGDGGVLSSVSALQSLFGEERAVPHGNEILTVPPSPVDELRQVRGDVSLVVTRVNEARVAESVGALLIANPITSVAETRAETMYASGRVGRDNPPGGSVADDLAGAGILLEVEGEVMALASTTRAALDALLADEEAVGYLTSPGFDRLGASIVQGPTGVLLLIILGG